MRYLVVWILWPELPIYLQGIWFFDKFAKPALTLKTTVEIVADFDIKIRLLGQNSFE